MGSEVLFRIIFTLSGMIAGALINYIWTSMNRAESLKEIEEAPKKKDINPQLLDIITKEGYVDKVNALIDSLINVAGEYFTILSLSSNSNHYINEKEIDRMTAYIFGMTKKNMTNDIKAAIGTVYKIDYEEELDKVLNLRIKLYVINFVRNYNSLPEDIPNLSNEKK